MTRVDPEAIEKLHTPNSGELDLVERFSDQRIGQLINDFVAPNDFCEVGLASLLGERRYIVAYIPAMSDYSDIGRAVEARVFSKTFKEPLEKVVEDYGKYDENSVFAVVIDMNPENGDLPKAAGALRITKNSHVGFKDVNDLLVDEDENPWIDEIKTNYFEKGEAYKEKIAWDRLGEKACGQAIQLEDSLDIASHASMPEYAGVNGAIDGVSMLFYHACLRYALAHDKAYLLAIYDLPPLDNIQQFGKPFDTYDGLSPHPYGGPFPTIPAFCKIEEGLRRMKRDSTFVYEVFRNGAGLSEHALLPSEYNQKYANLPDDSGLL